MKQNHHFQQQKHLLSNIIWEIQGINQVRFGFFFLIIQNYISIIASCSGINPRQTVRRDSFNWLSEPANNSNSASMYFLFSLEHDH
jgi:hypothetical protein